MGTVIAVLAAVAVIGFIIYRATRPAKKGGSLESGPRRPPPGTFPK